MDNNIHILPYHNYIASTIPYLTYIKIFCLWKPHGGCATLTPNISIQQIECSYFLMDNLLGCDGLNTLFSKSKTPIFYC